jgi:hypothetical protein
VCVCLIVLLGFVALAIDIGMLTVARNQCQNAADSAAMAGVRTFSGDQSNGYGKAQVPINAVQAATDNYVLGNPVPGDANNVTTVVADYMYTSGNVTIEIGSYYYYYSDATPPPPNEPPLNGAEGFYLRMPRDNNSQPWSAVRSTVTWAGQSAFGRIFNVSAFNTQAQAVAVHRPRDVMNIMDLSGSMRFQSLPGRMHGGARVGSMNPETVFPKFGHYSDISGAALQGTSSYPTGSGEYYDPCNISCSSNSGPPIAEDFFRNPVGTPLTEANKSSYLAFSRAPDSQETIPGGDNYLKINLDAGGSYAKTIREFNNNSTNTNVNWETQGYQSVRPTFAGYTEGPGYWGKTFWIWPPDPRGATQAPPASLSTASSVWKDNGAKDWRQRFFVKVNTATNAPDWLDHSTILYDASGYVKSPGTSTSVTENGTSVTYRWRPNYLAILNWLQNTGPNPFPSTLQAGRIRYYSAFPNVNDNTLNNRWWTTADSGLPSDERLWKEYIDFVLGIKGTGAGTWTTTSGSNRISAMIGPGDPFNWTGGTFQLTARPQQKSNSAPYSDPWYRQGLANANASSGATSVSVKNLGGAPVANRDYLKFSNHSTYYLITSVSGSGPWTLGISPSLKTAITNNVTGVNVYGPVTNYTDNPRRPRHHYWFGPMTFIDWLGNYNTGNWLWPGNVHEAQGWVCKVGIQTAIDDIQKNHPNDFVGLSFFSSPKYSAADSGKHNRALVAMGQSYQQLKDSLWFPPTTVTGTATEIGPYSSDMANVPRAQGGTCPGMSLMIAYNQFSSSSTNLRYYAAPQPQYRGDAGGLGRAGAYKMIVLVTDGAPNTQATATFVSSGADSYYRIRIKNPANLSDSANVEWPTGGTYDDNAVYNVAQQICALTTANPPGFSTPKKPVIIHCIAYGSLFAPSGAGATQTDALQFLATLQNIGGNPDGLGTSDIAAYKKVYGTVQERINKMQQAYTAIMQQGTQVSMIQ